MLRSVVALSPPDLLPVLYLSLNHLGPPQQGLELGVGDGVLLKAVAQATGKRDCGCRDRKDGSSARENAEVRRIGERLCIWGGAEAEREESLVGTDLQGCGREHGAAVQAREDQACVGTGAVGRTKGEGWGKMLEAATAGFRG